MDLAQIRVITCVWAGGGGCPGKVLVQMHEARKSWNIRKNGSSLTSLSEEGKRKRKKEWKRIQTYMSSHTPRYLSALEKNKRI